MRNNRGGIGVVILIILLIAIGIGAYFVISSGMLDPCKSKLQECNYGCGEGILNSICKEKCSYDYRSCENA